MQAPCPAARARRLAAVAGARRSKQGGQLWGHKGQPPTSCRGGGGTGSVAKAGREGASPRTAWRHVVCVVGRNTPGWPSPGRHGAGQVGQLGWPMVETLAPHRTPESTHPTSPYEAGGRGLYTFCARRKLGCYFSRSDMNNALSQFRMNQLGFASSRCWFGDGSGGRRGPRSSEQAEAPALVGTLQMERRAGGPDGAAGAGVERHPAGGLQL